MLSFSSFPSRRILCIRHYCKNTPTKLRISEAISGSKLGDNIKVQVRKTCLLAWFALFLAANTEMVRSITRCFSGSTECYRIVHVQISVFPLLDFVVGMGSFCSTPEEKSLSSCERRELFAVIADYCQFRPE